MSIPDTTIDPQDSMSVKGVTTLSMNSELVKRALKLLKLNVAEMEYSPDYITLRKGDPKPKLTDLHAAYEVLDAAKRKEWHWNGGAARMTPSALAKSFNLLAQKYDAEEKLDPASKKSYYYQLSELNNGVGTHL